MRMTRKWLAQDRYGIYFVEGCRVKDIYSDKYGEVVGYIAGTTAKQLAVRFDGEEESRAIRPVCLEVLGGGFRLLEGGAE